MDAMQAVADALGELADEELQDLRDAANELVLIAAGLVSWVEHLVHWETNRRAGLTFDLQSPHVVIPPDEHAVSTDAAGLLRARFEQTPQQDVMPCSGCSTRLATRSAGARACDLLEGLAMKSANDSDAVSYPAWLTEPTPHKSKADFREAQRAAVAAKHARELERTVAELARRIAQPDGSRARTDVRYPATPATTTRRHSDGRASATTAATLPSSAGFNRAGLK
jgi:hypothetical protein